MKNNQTEYKHELIIPNESIPVKIFSFSAHNDFRIIPKHWHRSAEILYVRRGQLNIYLNKKTYKLKQNDFMYINSKEVHSTQSPIDNDVIVLQIPGDFLEKYSNEDHLVIKCNTIDIKDNSKLDEIKKIIYQMYLFSEKKDKAFHLKIYSFLFDLGYILVKYFQMETKEIDIYSNKYLDRLSEICNYMKENFRENITLNSVANQFGYSPQYLSRMFQKYTNSTFLSYLNAIRLDFAYKQITQTDLSILEIAENNGFANVKSLNKLFKDTYGITPSNYRKKLKNDLKGVNY